MNVLSHVLVLAPPIVPVPTTTMPPVRTRARCPVSNVRFKVHEEWQEIPAAVERQAAALEAPLAELLRHLRRAPPSFVVTCARGSSAHAATFGKHLIERHLGVPVGAFAPNIATIYRRRLQLSGQLFLTVSQSGKSDDLLESVAMAKAAGALASMIVND